MSSCLSGGGRAYRLNLEIVKSPSTSWTSNASSPSSLSESGNSSIAISGRKPRTPRKRPNQTYNEAAALLSVAFPKIFSTKKLTKPCKFTKQQYLFSFESSDLFQPFEVIDNSSFLINPPTLENPGHPAEKKLVISCEKPCLSPGEINSKGNSLEFRDELQDDFDAESILDEEIEEGIDSILGNLDANNEFHDESDAFCCSTQVGTRYGFPVGLGFGVDFDSNSWMRNSISPFRNVDEGDWWRCPSVNVRDLTPKFSKPSTEKKKKKKPERPVELSKNSLFTKASSIPSRATKDNSAQKDVAKEEPNNTRPKFGLLLKLNCNDVLNAWSDRGLPFSDDFPVVEAAGKDSDVCF